VCYTLVREFEMNLRGLLIAGVILPARKALYDRWETDISNCNKSYSAKRARFEGPAVWLSMVPSRARSVVEKQQLLHLGNDHRFHWVIEN